MLCDDNQKDYVVDVLSNMMKIKKTGAKEAAATTEEAATATEAVDTTAIATIATEAAKKTASEAVKKAASVAKATTKKKLFDNE